MPEPSLRLLARLVPSFRREEWMREWNAEMAALKDSARRRRRLLDALEDAMRLRLRGARPGRMHLAGIGHDLGWATRSLVRQPLFALTCATILAVAIAAATLTFALVDAVLLQPLPYEEPDRVVLVWADGSARGLGLNVGQPPADILTWRRTATSFVDLAALRNVSYGLTELEEPLSPLTHEVTTNYFDLLGVEAALGRTFTDADADTRSVLVSDALWRGYLGADPAVVGSTLVLDDVGYEVLGVMPPEFWTSHQLPVQPELWVPISFVGHEDDRRDRRHAVFGRLRAGVTLDQAAAEMDALARQNEQAFPDTHRGWSASVVTVRDNAVGVLEPAFRVAALGVLVVLGIACANVANLIFARTASRRREVALRVALGAGHGRIVRQLLLESLLIAAVAGIAGLTVAFLALPAVVALLPGGGSTTVGGVASVPFLDRAAIDLRVAAFAVAITGLVALAAGLWPARRATRRPLRDELAEGGRGAAGGRGASRTRAALVAIETSLAMILTVAAVLMLQTVLAEYSVPLGYDADRVLTLRNSLRGPAFAEHAAVLEHFERAVERLESLPGVEAAGAVSFPPPEFANGAVAVRPAGRAPDPGTDLMVVPRVVVPGYFRALGIEVLRGRVPTRDDRGDGEPVVAINRALARQLFGDRDPIGEQIAVDVRGAAAQNVGGAGHRVIGVVDDLRSAGDDPTPQPIAYFTLAQVPVKVMNLMVRATPGIAPGTLAREATATVWSLSRSMNVYNVETLEARLGNILWQSRFALQTLAALAVVALLLGATGLYAVLSFAITERARELGVRMALGATRDAVLRMVVRDGCRLAAIGVVAGIVGSIAAGRVLEGLLYGVSATDPLTLGVVATLLIGVAAAASLAPALRATRVDPVEVLRAE